MADRGKRLVIIRGAGDLATGVAIRLFNSGFEVVMCESEKPSSIRRTVCFSEAVYDGEAEVEGVKAVLASAAEAESVIDSGKIPVLVDPQCSSVSRLKPFALVDAIIAKRNTGTTRDMAELTIGLGPGFVAGKDVDYVIETKRGHYLGSIISQGSAIANTGVPGIVGGYGKERVIFSDAAGIFRTERKIGDRVKKGDVVAVVSGRPQCSLIDGVIRGLLRDGYEVGGHFKCADVDPRDDSASYIHTVSDKARAIAGGVLECILHFLQGYGKIRNRMPKCGDIAGNGQAGKQAAVSAICEEYVAGRPVEVYSDGSFDVKTGAYSYGVVMICGGKIADFSGKVENSRFSQFRNVAGEIAAAEFTFDFCVSHGIKAITLYHDYVGIRCWCTGEWKTNNELTLLYRRHYDSIKNRLAVNFQKVKAHSGVEFNQRADDLARRALGSGK